MASAALCGPSILAPAATAIAASDGDAMQQILMRIS
jgi:hypothetical protein